MKDCPYCKREFTTFRDYPLIEVLNVGLLELPELIRGDETGAYCDNIVRGGYAKKVPEEVKKHFLDNPDKPFLFDKQIFTMDKINDDLGLYTSYEDCSAIVREISNSILVKGFLETIVSKIGQKVETKNLLDLEHFFPEGSTFDGFGLSMFNLDTRFLNNPLDNGEVLLYSVAKGTKEDYMALAYLADIKYKGLLAEPNKIE